ncbi:DNA mismatch repair endonuclease MutL [Candidatus Cytomitobacter primus]|uniref:DNA mismatch repair protein MutL n=1 Tax=Candidatus Cytomitobacter primus TaxID=2066024 RepID=A0A5C0UEA1_9PROT|nr:DNA mismatch repair endonuclease MutL [Candidatus Cytomitobacter primus]QEK38416.1 DNA mismatch repair endonuclease MutL [Candidatus Cytomitobacter primus]
MNIIRKLSDDLVRQISAGEVVVRPISVVKELVENAIDSGAEHIKICIENGGKTSIMVEDDGCGMCLSDLEMCLEQHATSKLTNLFQVHTLGFRGEALYAISSVADIEIVTCKDDESYALTCENQQVEITECKPREGTKITVTNLFQSLPARLKFLRSDYVEWNLIFDYLQKIMLAYPNITWKISNGKQIDKKYLAVDIQSRLADVFQDNGEFFKISHAHDGCSIEGMFSKRHHSSNNCVIFVNNRYVKDKGILACIRSTMSDYIPDKRWPMGIVQFTIPSHEVDVNVHPSKEEVRFMKWHIIRNILSTALYKSLNVVKSMSNHVSLSAMTQTAKILQKKHEFIDKEEDNDYSIEDAHIFDQKNMQKVGVGGRKVNIYKKEQEVEIDYSKFNQSTKRNELSDSIDIRPIPEKEEKHYRVLGQFKKSYIIVAVDDGILLVDQHAIHERHVYEKMKKEIKESTVGNKLLIPMQIPLSTKQKIVLEELKDKLARWGLSFYNEKLTSIPSFWNLNKIHILLDIFFDSIENFGSESEDRMLWGKFLADVACKNSIKAGMELNMQQMIDFVDTALNSVGVCNHGRKSTYLLKLKDVEKMFDRV